jgi:dihydroorotase
MSAPDRITIPPPDDWHVHFRDGAMLRAVAPYTAAVFRRAIVMPNLAPPVRTGAEASAYRARILAATAGHPRFTPLMTLYLTDATDPDETARAHAAGEAFAAKLYPQHATTNAAHGVTDVARLDPVFAAMERAGMPLLVHGEALGPEVDVFDREARFIERVLAPLARRHEGLRIVLEHVTTREGVDFVRSFGTADRAGRIGATITPQHMLYDRNALFAGGLRPHLYCLPLLKHRDHRDAVRRAATSGDRRFFLGTDSAPHPAHLKESACGCAGVFSAPVALAAYLEAFDEDGALDRFAAFASENGAMFHALPVNAGATTLRRRDVAAPARILVADAGEVAPLFAGGVARWRIDPAA